MDAKLILRDECQNSCISRVWVPLKKKNALITTTLFNDVNNNQVRRRFRDVIPTLTPTMPSRWSKQFAGALEVIFKVVHIRFLQTGLFLPLWVIEVNICTARIFSYLNHDSEDRKNMQFNTSDQNKPLEPYTFFTCPSCNPRLNTSSSRVTILPIKMQMLPLELSKHRYGPMGKIAPIQLHVVYLICRFSLSPRDTTIKLFFLLFTDSLIKEHARQTRTLIRYHDLFPCFVNTTLQQLTWRYTRFMVTQPPLSL